MLSHECGRVGCHALININDKYCDKHRDFASKEYNRYRQLNQHDYLKFYHSKEWKHARELQLIRQPLCEICLSNDHVTQATTVHHKVETKVDWSLRLSENNLQSVCKSCHEKIYKGRWYGGK
ncbi:HNH endonuclease [Latilactobacillus sakei]|uniref:HNH endonuclease n=1 Tax=Latilactobacillus sakei TaxID=1599 RepID=UPI000DD2EC47